MAFSNAHFGAGIGSTFLDDVICSGSESSLLDCTRASTVYCYTGHQEDAGVRCYSKSRFWYILLSYMKIGSGGADGIDLGPSKR